MRDGFSDKELIELLAGGAVIEADECTLSGWRVITPHGSVDARQILRLTDEGILSGFPSGRGARLSDKGLKSYMRSVS